MSNENLKPTAKELIDALTAEDNSKLTQTWLAFSATNIVFDYKNRLILGVLTDPSDKAIPESGDLCLIGGFNGGILEGPVLLKDLADAHLKNMLGTTVTDDQCEYFTHSEFGAYEPMPSEPLKTPFGEFNIKRMAFDRIVKLNKQQSKNLKPAGKIKSTVALSYNEFLEMYCVTYGGNLENCRFKYQCNAVISAFNEVNKNFVQRVALWIYRNFG